MDTLPFRAEYAKSGRAACKGCKNTIAKDELRLAVMVQSPFFDGKQPQWHHFSCFFGRCRPKEPSEISHFESLRWEDQEKIKKKIESLDGTAAPSSGKGRGKGKKRNLESNVPFLADFTIEYSKSGKAKCRLCQEYIKKDDVRISKKDYESEIALQYGPHERWHHVDCFLKVREELNFFASGSCLPGFKSLSPDDQAMIKKKILEIKREDNMDGPSPSKKPKEKISEDVKKEMQKQNKTMFKYRDQLEALTKAELHSLYTHNFKVPPDGLGPANILDRLADAMAFGVVKPCGKCSGLLTFRSGQGYACTGHISEWARCENLLPKPPRVPFKAPNDLKEEYSFLKKYEGKVMDRLFVEVPAEEKQEVSKVVKTEAPEIAASSSSTTPLDSIQFFIHKLKSKSANDVKSKIKELGGKSVSKFVESITAVVSTEEEVNKSKLSKALKSAQDSDVPVLSEDFFDGVSSSTSRGELIDQLKEKTISSWGLTVIERLPPEKEAPQKSGYPKKSERFKSGESVKTITLKDGLVVDPDSNLDKVAHVYRNGKDIYTAVLSLTDVQRNKNSYYKLQVLQCDKTKKCWLFRAWGRIGTTIGGNTLDRYGKIEDCVYEFERLFEEKTGNPWSARHNFQKIPGMMMMLEVNCKEENNQIAPLPKSAVVQSTLHKAVQDLITLIFDIDVMRKTMMEFELDLVKMPLGKISRSQIQKAFDILSELQNFVKTTGEKDMITDRTNRFYTLVPHDYGINTPPLLNNEEIIKEKIEVLNSLLEIETAYKILQECQEGGNTIDDHYRMLKTEITVVERDTDEFRLIETYVKNTHAKTHMNYSLEIEEVFKIEREGESKRFKTFRKLPNRKLLWHGSRITNFAGILSQGLRIAPPEAPSVGYMFGKGVYFADRVSKSANYCMTSSQNPTGLILLCDVALGKMYELTKAKYIQKLPSGKHSVKGMGKGVPDPNEIARTPSGAEVPLGPTIDADIKDSSLLYNEYIVYDVAQVKIEYLLRLKFNYRV